MLDRLTIERMHALAGEGPMLIALSGGGDSVALLHQLVAEFGAPRLRVAIVDHALREGSAHDAACALGFAQACGVAGEVLTLSWAVGENHAQQAAREARYAALCAHARKLAARVIAVAHNADDQAETVLMRAGAGSSWRGLAGMAAIAPAPLWPEGRGIVLARPLLGVRRAALRNYLKEQGGAWIEDPANANPMFERVRVRQRLAALEAAGFDPMRLVRVAARLRARADAVDKAAHALIQRAATFADWRIVIHAEAWKAPDEIRARALAALIAAASGAKHPPRSSQVAAIEQRIVTPAHKGSTHSGVVFAPHPDGVALEREQGAFMGRGAQAPAEPLHVALRPGVELVWDGRFAVLANAPGWRIVRDGVHPVLERCDAASAEAAVPTLRPLARDHVAHLLGCVNDAQA
ncbi:MAG: tRNA lysidine(34) synthetase TilS [Caulobacterales bacterium]|jgi:tRNA(Ile)-lysidine synthase|nr:tRNA lysidine(34) synthetase TilS [Caulobacterales bacterium]